MTKLRNEVHNISDNKTQTRSRPFLFWGNPNTFNEFSGEQDLLDVPLVVPASKESTKESRTFRIGPNHRVHTYDYVHEARYHSYENIHLYQPISKDYVSRDYPFCHEYSRVHEFDDPWEYFDYVDYRPHLRRYRRKEKGNTYVKVKPKAK